MWIQFVTDKEKDNYLTMKLCALLLCCVLAVQSAATRETLEESEEHRERNINSDTQHGVIGKLQEESQAETLTITAIPDFATTQLSSNLYEAVKESQSRNFVLSPLSLRNALATLSLGATGGTFDEIREALQFPEDTNHLIYNQSQLIQSLKRISLENSGVEFVAADKIYVNENLSVKYGYRKKVEELGGEIENMDFWDSEAAAAIINAWVQHKTEGKIEQIADSSSLTSQTSILVLNTIYFKGQWKNQFPPEDTKKRSFFIRENKNVEVDTMVQENHFVFAYLDEAKAQVINLPYQGDRLSMMIYLPNQQSSLEHFEDWLKNQSPFEIQKQHMQESQNQSIKIFLPKFKIRSSLQLNEPLKSLGLRKMFEAHDADFRNIFENERSSFVSKVSQETFIEVNEEGTEAAAATGLGLSETSFGTQFIVNRPFLFQILDQTTQTVLFTGRVKDPRAESANSPVSAEETDEAEDSTATSWTNSNVTEGSGDESTAMEGNRYVEEDLLNKFIEHVNRTMANFESRMAELEFARVGAAERWSEVRAPNPTATRQAPNYRQENSMSIPTAAAWGYEVNSFSRDQLIQWEYNSAFNGACWNFYGSIYSVYLNGPCVMLYRHEDCSGDEFQLNTTNSYLGQDIQKKFPRRSYPGFYASPMSVGTCV